MNDVIKLLNSHRSIRKFTDQEIPHGLLLELIKAGQAAATSSQENTKTTTNKLKKERKKQKKKKKKNEVRTKQKN